VTEEQTGKPEVSVLYAALACRCPRCGKGPLFQKMIEVRPICQVCGLDLAGSDPGDGAIVGAILVLGAILVIMAFWVEFHFSPPLWVHAILWPVVSVPLAIALIRPSKAALVALQYRFRASEMGL
jgi:uncharacterized protein (DUF983 family)